MTNMICTCRQCGVTHNKKRPNPFCSSACRKFFNSFARNNSTPALSILSGDIPHDRTNTKD